jgi:hypothetical protein
MGWMPTRNQRQNSTRATDGGVRPAARTEDLVIEELGAELLIYDRTTARAHCLGEAAARVWRLCDGYTSVPVLANKLDMDPDTVIRAIEEIDRCGLLQETPALGGSTRREFSMRTAKLGAVAASVPLIVSMAVPAGAFATTTVAQCARYTDFSCSNCANICGCCCCCEGSVAGTTASCKLCYPTGLCPSYQFSTSVSGPNCNTDHPIKNPHCSATAKAGCLPPDPNATPGCVYNG